MTDNTAQNLEPPVPTDQQPCGCGRSATGFCTGLHELSDEEWDARVFDEAFDQPAVGNANEQQ